MPFSEAMEKYGSDKPDIRFGMQFINLNTVTKGCDFKVFDDAERARLWELAVAAFPNYAEYQDRTDRKIPLFVAE